MRALIKGDERTWNTFHQRYAHRLRAYLKSRWQGPEHHLDDLLQETLLRAVRYLKPHPTEEAFWSWLAVLARSAIADHGRKQSRFHRLLQRFHLEPKITSIPSEEHLTKALAKLDETSQQLLRWKYHEGHSVCEIANNLSLSEKAVEGRLTRARHKLRKILRKQHKS